jgi:hypothetical protein
MLPPMQFKTVKQPKDSRLCVAAVAAMAVGRGLRYAMNRMPSRRWRDGKPHHKTRDLLAFLGGHGIYCGLTWCIDSDGSVDMLEASVTMAGRAAICVIQASQSLLSLPIIAC